MTEEYKKKNVPNINAGVYMGGTDLLLDFLHRINEYYKPTHPLYTKNNYKEWGVDQTIVNKMYYNGEFDGLNITIDHCTQRYCYRNNGEIRTNKETTTLVYPDGCSPVVLHKRYPKTWDWYFPYAED